MGLDSWHLPTARRLHESDRRSPFAIARGWGSAHMRIRGPSARFLGGDPLVFINGVRTSEDQSQLGDVDPEDIEKISVIKGSKAVELYGPDAEYGVILITLKDSVSTREKLR